MNEVVVNQECDKCNIEIHARYDRLQWITKTHWAYEASVSYTHLDVYKRQPCRHVFSVNIGV